MTTKPHSRSFLAFACWVQEYFDHWDSQMRDYDPASSPLSSVEAVTAQFLAYYASAASDRRALFALLARQRLEQFVPARILATEKAAAFVSRYADELAALIRHPEELAAARQPQEPRRPICPESDEWFPNRKTQVEITVGAYLSLPDAVRSCGATADLLNRGTPTGVKNIDGDHVRNALNTFARQAIRLRSSEMWSGACWGLLHRWLVLNALWARVVNHVRPKPVTFDLVERLADEGLLHEWRLEVDREALECVPSSAVIDELLRLTIKEIEGVRRRKVA
ncbi:hypothetical protein HF206_07570 [Rhizobium leguminosarum]|uniref:hypothetical protein n=1 Tax=Rhizobium leguminosarum TaxID=384 RepID=UPI001C917D7D|nr:hypothetical protein [Rhizobium leguminosarum]MBY2913979.1 hypothetical protein [Rhizobium leguminosarum]